MSDVTVSIGDVVHFAVPDERTQPFVLQTFQPQPDLTIAELLAQSRAAHAQFQTHTGAVNRDGTIRTSPNDPGALEAIQVALNARAIADATDPAHADPAWAADEQANRGVTSDALLLFYRDYVEPD